MVETDEPTSLLHSTCAPIFPVSTESLQGIIQLHFSRNCKNGLGSVERDTRLKVTSHIKLEHKKLSNITKWGPFVIPVLPGLDFKGKYMVPVKIIFITVFKGLPEEKCNYNLKPITFLTQLPNDVTDSLD